MSDSGVDAEDTVDQEQQWDIKDYQSFFQDMTGSREDIFNEAPSVGYNQSDSGYGSIIDPLLTVNLDFLSPRGSIGPLLFNDNLNEHSNEYLSDRLVHLFFKHVHPLCPVMEEAAFYTRYRQSELSGTTHLDHVTVVELHAMKFAASLFLTDREIYELGYHSVSQYHAELFHVARTCYHANKERGPISLTKTALLLSFWSPYDSQTEVNGYWVDRAFYHARQARLESSATNDSFTGNRNRLIWWCCLLRDRSVAFGLHRHHDLHDRDAPTGMVQEGDFGLEALCCSFTEHSLKRRQIQAFISIYQLSQVMRSIMNLQKGLKDGVCYDEKITKKEIKRLEHEIFHLDTELVDWTSQVPNSSLRTCGEYGDFGNVALQLPFIFYLSAKMALYLPFINMSSSLDAFDKCTRIQPPVEVIKLGASAISRRFEVITSQAIREEIPLAMGAWIVFPLAVQLIKCRNAYSSCQDLQDLRSLMRVLSILKERFHGGQFVAQVLDAVILYIRTASVISSEIALFQGAARIIKEGLSTGNILRAHL